MTHFLNFLGQLDLCWFHLNDTFHNICRLIALMCMDKSVFLVTFLCHNRTKHSTAKLQSKAILLPSNAHNQLYYALFQTLIALNLLFAHPQAAFLLIYRLALLPTCLFTHLQACIFAHNLLLPIPKTCFFAHLQACNFALNLFFSHSQACICIYSWYSLHLTPYTLLSDFYGGQQWC